MERAAAEDAHDALCAPDEDVRLGERQATRTRRLQGTRTETDCKQRENVRKQTNSRLCAELFSNATFIDLSRRLFSRPTIVWYTSRLYTDLCFMLGRQAIIATIEGVKSRKCK